MMEDNTFTFHTLKMLVIRWSTRNSHQLCDSQNNLLWVPLWLRPGVKSQTCCMFLRAQRREPEHGPLSVPSDHSCRRRLKAASPRVGDSGLRVTRGRRVERQLLHSCTAEGHAHRRETRLRPEPSQRLPRDGDAL